MSFNFKPKVTKDREATDKEIKCIEETEEMLDTEQKLPPASQMVRDLATTHWKSLKAFVKGKQVIVPQEVAEERWEICKKCPHLLYDETIQIQVNEMVDVHIVVVLWMWKYIMQ